MDFEPIVQFQVLLEYFKNEIQNSVDTFAENVIKKIRNASEAPLIVRFDINYDKLMMDQQLKVILDSILNEPLQSLENIRTAVWIYIFSHLVETYPQLNTGLQLQQIHCVMRLSNLPVLTEFEFAPFRHPVRLSLSVMKCILYSFNDRCHYVRQSIWYCAKQCANNQKHIIAGEHTSVGKCSVCDGNLNEYEHQRSTFNSRLIRVFEARSFDTPVSFGHICRDIRVKLSDELCDVDLVLGEVYLLTGTYDIQAQTYIAWNFYKFQE